MNTEAHPHVILPELRVRYAKRLVAQSKELLDFVALCERGSLNQETRRGAQILVHSLCGTGTTFGFPDVTEAALFLEGMLDSGPTEWSDEFVDPSLKLVRACSDAADEVIDADDAQNVGQDDEPEMETGRETAPTLLVIGGDEQTTATVSDVFRTQMDVVHTPSVMQALDLLKLKVPSAIIFDMAFDTMAVGQALEAVYLEARKERTPVIALAPNRRAAAIAHAVSTGHIHTILKPLSTDQLYSSTRATIEQTRLFALLCDDDVIVRELMTNRFRASGFAVIGAKDGPEVLELAIKHRPSVIVLDRILPGLEGLAVLEMLKGNPSTNEIPVVMLTAKRKASEIVEARRAGAADYIVKPFTPDYVVSRCLRALGRMH
jgi:DNA-binding response OmpR family regulator